MSVRSLLVVVGIACANAGCTQFLSFDGLSGGEEKPKPKPVCTFSFAPETRFPTSGYTQDVALADFDGDKHLDIVVAEVDPEADATGPELLKNLGKGQFEYWTGVSKFTLISRSVAAGDIDGDHHADVAVSYQKVDPSTPSGSFDTELGDGIGNIGGDGQIFDVPQADDIALGDFNGDGHTDVALTGTPAPNGYEDDKLYVFLGQSDGRLAEPTVYDKNQLDSTLNAVEAGDLNGDGLTDLCVSHWGNNTLHVLMGSSDGTFFVRGPFATGNVPRGMAIADFTHDGVPDVAVASNADNSVSVHQGLGQGLLGAEKPYQMLVSPTYALTNDFDADGNPDLVVSGDNQIALRLGTSNGDFGDVALYPIDGTPLQLASGDLNGDGIVDLAVANPGRKSISVYFGRCGP